MKARSLLLLLTSFFIFRQSYAQYCTPAVTSSGVYYMAVHFNLPGHTTGVTSGTQSSSVSQGYANNSGSTWGTIQRNCGVGIPYNVYNPTAGMLPINMRVFIDWNSDFDFDDANELVYDFDFNLNPNTSVGTGSSWTTPPNAPSTVRVRYALRQGGSKATACGGYTGEIEDYTMTIVTNTAPAVNIAATGFINFLSEMQTNNEGVTTQQFYGSSLTGGNLTTDADNCVVGGFAITGTSGSNGQWQYKIGAGSWTDFGAVSTSNALLLAANNSTRIRFVPTGPGTPGFNYMAWDLNSGGNGQYANISSTGGTTAFSTAGSSASVIVYSAATVSADVNIYMASAGNPTNIYNVKSSSLTRGIGMLKNPETVTTDNLNGYGNDIAIDNVNNKLVWAGGGTATELLRSNFDGSGQQTLLTGVFTWPTGVAVGGNKVFIMDAGVGIFSCNPDGSGLIAITGGAGQANDINGSGDIEYNSNKLYYVNTPDYASYNIMQTNTDGTGTTSFYTTSSAAINGLALTGNTLYWTESDGTNSTIKSKPLSGGSVSTIYTIAGMGIYDLIVDEMNAKIYFHSINFPGYDKPRINSIPLGGGIATRLLDLEDNAGGIAFNIGLTTLPVHFISVKAYWQNSKPEVEWNVGTEDNLQKYIVQRSADGRQFTDAGSINATGRDKYTWLDMHPFDRKNYYRIKAVDTDGSFKYSNIVMINTDKTETAITVYPTVVPNKQFNLKLENAVAGKYQINAINTSGQPVFTQTVMHSGGSAVLNIALPSGIAAGIYKLKIIGQDKSIVQTIIVN